MKHAQVVYGVNRAPESLHARLTLTDISGLDRGIKRTTSLLFSAGPS